MELGERDDEDRSGLSTGSLGVPGKPTRACRYSVAPSWGCDSRLSRAMRDLSRTWIKRSSKVWERILIYIYV